MTHLYVPAKKPRLQDLAKFATIYDQSSFNDRSAWARSSKRPKIVTSMLADIGGMHAAEIHGDLHVKGDFHVAQYGIVALRVHGNLIVDGTYSDPSEPDVVVLISGDLRANAIVTGAHLEVQGNVNARHLAGDYNDQMAIFPNEVNVTTFFPENHHFEFSRAPTIGLVIGESASSRVPTAIGKHITPVPDGALDAYLVKGCVDSAGEIDSDTIYKRLRAGKDILMAEPGSIVPELANFPPALRAKLAIPASVTSAVLKNRKLTELPRPLLACSNLTRLDLEDNKLVSLVGIATFTKLATLNLDSNPLAALPTEMQQLTQLRSLSLRYTSKLSSLPTWLGKLQKLDELWITLSALKSAPTILATLPSLKKLHIWHLFDVAPRILVDTINIVSEMKLSQVGFFQGQVSELPSNLDKLAAIKNVQLINLGLKPDQVARMQQILPHAVTSWQRK
jgi:hypothetical protein